MLQRLLTGLAGTCAGLVALSGVASAAPAPRLEGSYFTTMRVVSSTMGWSVGTVYYADFAFTPRCARGACTTVMHYDDGYTSNTITLTLTKGVYSGSHVHWVPCFDGGGGVLVPHGYRETESFSVVPRTVKNGKVDEWAGRDKWVDVIQPAAAGNPACHRGGQTTYALRGSRFSSSSPGTGVRAAGPESPRTSSGLGRRAG